MISWYENGELRVACAECKRRGLDCPYPPIAAEIGVKGKEDPSCSLGQPNEKLRKELMDIDYSLVRIKGANRCQSKTL